MCVTLCVRPHLFSTLSYVERQCPHFILFISVIVFMYWLVMDGLHYQFVHEFISYSVIHPHTNVTVAFAY